MAQTERPPLVASAFEEAERRAEAAPRFAFTRTVTRGEDGFSARFDPSAPEGQVWTLIDPASEDALSKEARETLEAMRAQTAADRNILFRGPPGAPDAAGDDDAMPEAEADQDGGEGGVSVGLGLGDDLRLVREDAANAVFAFTPATAGDGEGMSQYVNGELTLAKDGPGPMGFRFFAPEAFKPSPVARVKTLNVAIRFEEMTPGGPLAMVSMNNDIAGSAMFRSFEDQTRILNFDFAPVEMPEVEMPETAD